MDWKIELVAIPVSDVDRAKDFYTEKVSLTGNAIRCNTPQATEDRTP
jgi:catechol 2,3-dioxygenase-like lactoylglutathione lyase family enzyme